MIIAFRRWLTPPHSVSMVLDIDGSWDHLKLSMCRAWGVEHTFDDNGVWTLLRNGDTVIVEDQVFCVFNRDWDDGKPFNLFEPKDGTLQIIDLESADE